MNPPTTPSPVGRVRVGAANNPHSDRTPDDVNSFHSPNYQNTTAP